ncbi:MAG: hypothetical protein AAF548_05235 [Actinomycetota bacterium]
MSRVEDPGWRPAWRGGLLGILPIIGPRQVLQATDGLVLMRQLWLSFVTVMVLIGVPVLFLWSLLGSGGIDARVVAAVLMIAGVLTQVVIPRLLPPLRGHSEDDVRHAIHRTFFIRVALAESVALLAFMGVLLSGNAAVYAVGLVVGLIGMAEIAPTARWVDERQSELDETGSTVMVLRALTRAGIS